MKGSTELVHLRVTPGAASAPTAQGSWTAPRGDLDGSQPAHWPPGRGHVANRPPRRIGPASPVWQDIRNAPASQRRGPIAGQPRIRSRHVSPATGRGTLATGSPPSPSLHPNRRDTPDPHASRGGRASPTPDEIEYTTHRLCATAKQPDVESAAPAGTGSAARHNISMRSPCSRQTTGFAA